MTTLAERFQATDALPAAQREVERDILAIMFSTEKRLRDDAIEESANVTRLADARTKPSRDGV